MDRVILHVDMNAFYASVEQLYHPEAIGKPMAVCGDPDSRHGIILAKNELAKGFGIKTAETVWQARRRCPELLLLPPHHGLYEEYSQKANDLYRRYTDMVEPVSIDESYLDVTGSLSLFGTGPEIADSIRRSIRDELGLTVSVGVSFCKIFAKLGSDYKKPDATTVISRDNFRKVLYPLPVTDLLYVGAATAKSLSAVGIHTIGDLAEAGESFLTARLGKHGRQISLYANGQDTEPVKGPEDREPVKSVGNSLTFRRNLLTMEDIRGGLLTLAESVGSRLRRHGFKCRGVQISIKDPQFRTIDRQQQLSKPTNVTKELYETGVSLVAHSWTAGSPIRLLSLTAINLTGLENQEQLSLFDAPGTDAKREALDTSVDRIRERFGKDALKPAAILKSDFL